MSHPLHKISYGLYIVSALKDGKKNGCIVNTVFQITSDPATVAVSVNKENLSNSFIKESGGFTISVLSEKTPMTFIGPFGFRCGADVDKFEGIEWKEGKNGLPIVTENCVAFFETKVRKTVDVGTHTLFIGEITDSGILSQEAPMTYAYYHKVKGGKTPEKAATFISGESKTESKSASYRCKVCGYIYNPDKGDPENGVPAGTEWKDVPEDWVCPLCGAGKEEFEKI